MIPRARRPEHGSSDARAELVSQRLEELTVGRLQFGPFDELDRESPLQRPVLAGRYGLALHGSQTTIALGADERHHRQNFSQRAHRHAEAQLTGVRRFHHHELVFLQKLPGTPAEELVCEQEQLLHGVAARRYLALELSFEEAIFAGRHSGGFEQARCALAAADAHGHHAVAAFAAGDFVG